MSPSSRAIRIKSVVFPAGKIVELLVTPEKRLRAEQRFGYLQFGGAVALVPIVLLEPFQQVHESSWDLVNSVNEASQSFANNLVVMQENTLKFAQNVYLSWMELLTQQSESVQRLNTLSIKLMAFR
jgi:hypothetical protein